MIWFCYFWKKIVLVVAHGDTIIVVEVGLKNGNF